MAGHVRAGWRRRAAHPAFMSRESAPRAVGRDQNEEGLHSGRAGRGLPRPAGFPAALRHTPAVACARMAQTHQLSRAAYERLKAEHDDLTTRGRIQIAQAIERARELGDLSENGDYHA